jgi:hypothetical protein
MICIADKSTKLRSGCSYGRLKRQAERRHFFSAELWGCAYFRTQFKASPLPNAAIPTTRDGALRKLVEIAEFAGCVPDDAAKKVKRIIECELLTGT